MGKGLKAQKLSPFLPQCRNLGDDFLLSCALLSFPAQPTPFVPPARKVPALRDQRGRWSVVRERVIRYTPS